MYIPVHWRVLCFTVLWSLAARAPWEQTWHRIVAHDVSRSAQRATRVLPPGPRGVAAMNLCTLFLCKISVVLYTHRASITRWCWYIVCPFLDAIFHVCSLYHCRWKMFTSELAGNVLTFHFYKLHYELLHRPAGRRENITLFCTLVVNSPSRYRSSFRCNSRW